MTETDPDPGRACRLRLSRAASMVLANNGA